MNKKGKSMQRMSHFVAKGGLGRKSAPPKQAFELIHSSQSHKRSSQSNKRSRSPIIDIPKVSESLPTIQSLTQEVTNVIKFSLAMTLIITLLMFIF